MNKTADKKFQTLLINAKSDPNIFGFFLVGSRGKGFQHSGSDYDAVMIVRDTKTKKYKMQWRKKELEDIDLMILSLTEFKNYAKWGSPKAWDRYDFAHVKALVDKTGKIQKIIDEKGGIPKKVRRAFISQSLDAYINAVFRSVECFCNKNTIGARLEAASSIPYLLDVVFVLNGRIRPFFGYLGRELKKYPLKKFPWPREKFLKNILKILETADLRIQQKLLKDVESWARKEGFGKVFDEWEGKDKWAMNFQFSD